MRTDDPMAFTIFLLSNIIAQKHIIQQTAGKLWEQQRCVSTELSAVAATSSISQQPGASKEIMII